MTIHDLRCDVCGRFLAGPGSGVRFGYHPGVPELRDNSGLACLACWDAITRELGSMAGGRCAACRQPVTRQQSLFLRSLADRRSWQLCAAHAVGFLNQLRTVEPKLDPAAFRFPGRGPAAADQGPASAGE
jgi:hypothetical protein